MWELVWLDILPWLIASNLVVSFNPKDVTCCSVVGTPSIEQLDNISREPILQESNSKTNHVQPIHEIKIFSEL